MKKGIEIAFVVLFFALCLIPGLGMLILPEEENRANQVLTAEPDLLESDGSLNWSYFSEFQDYFADHFAFRQELITMNAEFLDTLFQTSNTDQVVIGKDGWLFYESTIGDYLNIPTMTERSAANAAISLSLMQEYAEKNGARFIFMVAPNKTWLWYQTFKNGVNSNTQKATATTCSSFLCVIFFVSGSTGSGFPSENNSSMEGQTFRPIHR